MNPIGQVILDGVLTGSSYALMAAGLALILGVVKVINLAHGAFFTLGAYVAYVLASEGIGNPAAAIAMSAVIAFAFGIFLGKSFINPVRFHPFSVAVGTLGFTILFEQAAQIVWGPQPVAVDAGPAWTVLPGLVVRRWGAISLLASAAILGGLSLFLASEAGLPLKLISEDEEIAGAVGMNVEKIRYVTFGVASAIAAVAGVLLAPTAAIVPTMGRGPLILSLIVVIASGMDKVSTILFVGMGVGLLSNLAAYLLAPEWSYIFLLAAICILLSVRPAGVGGLALRRDY